MISVKNTLARKTTDKAIESVVEFYDSADTVIRRQYTYMRAGNPEFIMTLRHPINGWWNGYALVKKEEWDKCPESITHAVTFAGYANSLIGWRLPKNKRVGQAVNLRTAYFGGSAADLDFWVGVAGRDFVPRHMDESEEHQFVYERVHQLILSIRIALA
jgi:hypothetical protein